ncbi:MAG: ABC-2 type transport system permease protein [Halobacteriales archaeon]|jgi:ABC-2 type transport system permease protein
MSWAAVAKKDFQDAVRSRALWGLSVVFLLFALVTTYAYVEFPDMLAGGDQSGVGLALYLAGVAGLFVSLAAILVAYKALAGERESGSIKLLLGLPHTRTDVVLGKVIGRSGVLMLPILVAFVLAGIYAAMSLDPFGMADYLIFVLMTLVLALAYVCIVVGISGSTGSTSRASALAIGFFLLFELLWDAISIGVVYVANGFAMPATFPDWLFVVNQIPPSSAYSTALFAVIPDAMGRGGAGEIDAFYGTPWLGVVMLAFWIVVPLAIGHQRFNSTDL